MFRDVVDCVDAATELVRHRIERPSMIVARNMFELWMQLKYLTLENQVERGRGYLLYHRLAELNAAEGTIRFAKENEIPIEENSKVPIGRMAYIAQNMLEEIKKSIETKNLSNVWQQYSSLKKKPRRWYSLDGGPPDLRSLSKLLEAEEYYLSLYKPWSGVIHGERAFDNFELIGVQLGGIAGFRNGIDLPNMTSTIHSIFLSCAQTFVASLIPDRVEDFANWYVKQGRSRFEWMGQLQFVRPQTNSGVAPKSP